MAQLVKALVAKLDCVIQSLEPTGWKQRTESNVLSPDMQAHTHTQMHGFLKGKRMREKDDLLRDRKKGWADILRWEMWMKRRYSCTLRKASLIPKHEKFN